MQSYTHGQLIFIATIFFSITADCQKENCLTYTTSINLLLIQHNTVLKQIQILLKFQQNWKVI